MVVVKYELTDRLLSQTSNLDQVNQCGKIKNLELERFQKGNISKVQCSAELMWWVEFDMKMFGLMIIMIMLDQMEIKLTSASLTGA